MDRAISASYLLADPFWFDNPAELAGRGSAHRLTRESLEDWSRSTHGIWTELNPVGCVLPEQGWKVHLSSTPADHEAVVDRAWEVCSEMRVPWKFLSHTAILNAQNDKASHRGASGKAVTVYPDGEQCLKELLDRLESALKGCEGPYILSDLRWKNVPVYLRYGAFARLVCLDGEGRPVPALRRPDGELTPDRRKAGFALPDWVDMPAWLKEGTGHDPDRVPDRRVGGYKVLKPLHYSNSGGVYLAEDDQGSPVVLKEARPHTGVDGRGRDAVSRLRNEYETLLRLADAAWAPKVHGLFQVWEHHFLAMEYIEGKSLQQYVVDGYPLIHPDPPIEDRRAYRDETLCYLAQLEAIVEDLHQRGLYFGDLHIKNVIVTPRGSLKLIDFEAAGRIDAPEDLAIGVPGYMTTATDDPVEKDWFAFAACQIGAMAPFNTLFHLNPTAIDEAVAVVEEDFDCRRDIVAQMRSRLGGGRDIGGRTLPVTRPGLLDAILDSARSERTDQLYPGDPAGLEDGGNLGLAWGASGVFLALLACGRKPPSAHVDWLAARAVAAPKGTPPGLYDGLGGAALLLHRLGHPSAGRVRDRVVEECSRLTHSLISGTVGGAHLCLDTGRPDDGLQLAGAVADSLDDPLAFSGPGALHGHSGAALLFARCHALTGDPSWVRAGLDALEAESRHAETNPHGTALGLRQRTGLYPYLGNGSAGYGLALLAWNDRLGDDLAEHLRLALDAARARVVLDGSLFNGRAGLTYFLAQASRILPDRHGDALECRRRQEIYFGRSPHGPAVIGRFGLRLSTDLATGSAGVAMVDEVLSRPQTCELPGFEFTVPETPRRPADATGMTSMKPYERI
ncbi:class III lanthionine synthetase LanKC [Salininema proteolyticum]|uniref:non-specific serine/threonine protein kinase n=1 Tax=Salininema proteolyticum TaxID=1607685 RepID=A0ABV8TZQ5_9ACTN